MRTSSRASTACREAVNESEPSTRAGSGVPSVEKGRFRLHIGSREVRKATATTVLLEVSGRIVGGGKMGPGAGGQEKWLVVSGRWAVKGQSSFVELTFDESIRGIVIFISITYTLR